MPCPSSERIEKSGSIAAVPARKDIGGVGGPEENALAPQIGRPSLVRPAAVGNQPSADHGFRKPCALLTTGRRAQVAKPGEALQLSGSQTAGPDLSELNIGER